MAETGLLTGWGRTAPTAATLALPADASQVADAVLTAPPRGTLARGLGRSYGDAAQLAGGRVLSTGRLRGLDLDATSGTLVAGSGCSLDEVLTATVPRGWFVPVTPGTRFVTLGGAVAADVHGKNHHRDGSLGAHLNWLELVDGLGRVHRLAPDPGVTDADPAAFWATVAGMGLTGVITRISLRLIRIESAWMDVETVRAPDLDAVMSALRDSDRTHRYTVAWTDLGARGASTGRGVVSSADHAPPDGSGLAEFRPPGRLAIPPLPVGLVGPLATRAFNEVWYRKAPRHHHGRERVGTFFYPLDGVRDWNRLYGPSGFLQYQLAVPDGAERLVLQVIQRLQSAGFRSSLAVLKRFGGANPAPLSFPRPGWTLALDLPLSRPGGLARVLDAIDQRVAASGGAVYLAKDSRLRPDVLAAMYPGLDSWREVRARLDPLGRFRSDLARRLQL